MPGFNIHWKGCPHRRFPRIRVASSSRTSIRSRTIAQLAAEEVVRSPLSTALEQERKRQLFRLRHRRALRRSRGSSAILRTRKRASQRARQHIQVFGWNPDIASKVNTENTGSKPSSTTARAGSRSGNTITGSTVIDSNDGAAASITRKPKNTQPENLYSLMHVAEVPVYCTSKKDANRKRFSRESRVMRGPRRVREYAHIGSLESVSRRSIHRAPQTVGRSRTYDPRIDPSAAEKSQRQTKSTQSQIKPTIVARPLEKKKQSQSWEVSEFFEAINSLQQKEGQATPQSTKSIVQSILADSASRTPSQRKTLQRFTKELELYLQATQSLPKLSLVKTPSSTTTSAYTIQALKPHQAEFQSAGLAVTSADQRRTTERTSAIRKELPPPPTPPKDEMSTPRKSLFGKSRTGSSEEKKAGKPKQPLSELSYSDGTDVIAFTPPHEKSERRDKRHHKRPSSSSDLTVLGFTPPHEKAAPQPGSATSAPKTPTKKSLPWLRKQELPPEEPPSLKNSIHASPKEMIPGSPTGRPEVVRRATERKMQDLKQVKERTTTRHVKGKRRAELIAQISSGADRKPNIQLQLPKYTDVSTQTIAIDHGKQPSESSRSIYGEDEVRETRAPLTSGRSKTFPIRQAENCKHFNQQSFGRAPAVSRPSRVTWKGVDDSTQTDPDTFGSWPFATIEADKEYELPAPPVRVPTLRPICTQCDTKLKKSYTNPEPAEDDEVEPISPNISAPRSGLSHSCTARSSIQCQQCCPPSVPSDPVSPLQTLLSEKQSRRPTKSYVAEQVTNSDSDHGASPEFERVNNGGVKAHKLPEERYTQRTTPADIPPVADPVKRPSAPRLKLRPITTSQFPNQIQNTAFISRPKTALPLPPAHMVLDNVFDIASSSTSPDSHYRDTSKIPDKEVFRGLHVATAAACDEDVDKWIEEITGSGVRRFLADLSAFDGLGFNSLAAVARSAAKQRRGELRAWERIRETRLRDRDGEMYQGQGCEEVSYVIVPERDRCDRDADGMLGLVACDQPVRLRRREKEAAKEPSREELVEEMGHKRDCKDQEDIKERAVGMGWRERSVSGGA